MRNKFVLSIVLIFLMLCFPVCDSAGDTDLPNSPVAKGQIDASRQPDVGLDEDQLLADQAAAAGEDEGDEVPRPEGWTKETHGKKGDPNYEVVFPDNKVNRMDIIITAADWQDMMDDMKAHWGPRLDDGGCGSTLFQEDATVMAADDEEEAGPGGCGGDSDAALPGFPSENPIYKPCTLMFEGKTWHHVGIRFKGNSSLRASWQSGSNKFPLRLTFDQYEDEFPEIDNQRFYGFQKASMSSNYSDDSLLREKVAADIFRDAGVPAPHTAFYRVFVDYGEGSKYFGLYTMVEIPDDPMLKTQFSDDGGNLYKPKGIGATFSTYVEADYDKENNEDEADYSDVRALYDALHADRTNAAAWRAGLEETLNVDGFLRWLAVNTTIQNWDTYGLMPQNYYLYNDPADTQLHWIPYDNNMSLSGGRALGFKLRAGNMWPLISYLINDPVYHAIYVKYVGETIATTFYPDRMQTIYKAAHDMIRPYVVGDEGEVPGYTLLHDKADFDEGLAYLYEHVQDRFDAAQRFIRQN